jgi:hypothetical protein
MVEIHSKIFLTRAAASMQAAITAPSAQIAVAPLLAVRLGAATPKASLRPWSISPLLQIPSGCAGGWPAIPVVRAKAGALTHFMVLGAHRSRVRRLRPHRQLRPRPRQQPRQRPRQQPRQRLQQQPRQRQDLLPHRGYAPFRGLAQHRAEREIYQ